MAELAIKGHATRGKEVIEILEMLGGINEYNYKAADCDSLCFYVCKSPNIIHYDWVNNCYEDEDVIVFTLEEFLEKFPYRVGDRVRIAEYESEVRIDHMNWDGYEVKYNVFSDESEWYSALELNMYNEPYKEQETPINFNSMTPVENIKEELYKWYPIVDEGEYWTDYDTAYTKRDEFEKISTIVTNGKDVWTYQECNLGWGTMAKQGDWKYMRIKLD